MHEAGLTEGTGVSTAGTHLGAPGPEERPAGSAGKGREEAAGWHTEGPAGLTFPYDRVHDQPGWIELLGEVQRSLGRVLICLEVHIRL